MQKRAAYAALFGSGQCFSFAICGEETALGDFAEFKAAFNTRGGRNGIRQGTVCETARK
ncbi:MAG: hypothetical protein ACLR56_02380 [Oscillospiraceae bacterium]